MLAQKLWDRTIKKRPGGGPGLKSSGEEREMVIRRTYDTTSIAYPLTG